MNKVIVIAGPTCSGKTKYAIEIAKRYNGEIVSCDSMQLYKMMNIGSAKPTKEEMLAAKHYLVDEIDPHDDFSVAKYREMALEAIKTIFSKGKIPIIEGGTGLYLNSILYEMDFSNCDRDEDFRKELEKRAENESPTFLFDMLREIDPEAAERIHPNNHIKLIRAIEGAKSGNKIADFNNIQKKNELIDPLLIAINRNREELYERINKRVDLMMENGLLDEVKELLSSGLTYDDISMKGIGYKELILFLEGKTSLDEAIDEIKKNTRHLAKRQITWFKRYDEMKWFNISDFKDENDAFKAIFNLIDDFIG